MLLRLIRILRGKVFCSIYGVVVLEEGHYQMSFKVFVIHCKEWSYVLHQGPINLFNKYVSLRMIWESKYILITIVSSIVPITVLKNVIPW